MCAGDWVGVDLLGTGPGGEGDHCRVSSVCWDPCKDPCKPRWERESSSYPGVREEVSNPLCSFQMLKMICSSTRLSWRRILGEQTRF